MHEKHWVTQFTEADEQMIVSTVNWRRMLPRRTDDLQLL